MLARDPVEIAEQANSFLKLRPVAAYFDEVVLPGLRLAAVDADKDLLDSDALREFATRWQRSSTYVASHEDDAEVARLNNAEKTEEAPLAHLQDIENSLQAVPSITAAKSILCLPGQSQLDEAAAMMIAHLLQRRGIGARFEPAGALSMSGLANWNTEGVELVCLCYVANVSAAQVRYAVRRIRRKIADARIVAALLWDADDVNDQEFFGDVAACGSPVWTLGLLIGINLIVGG